MNWKNLLSPEGREKLYALGVAIGALLVVTGVLSKEVLTAILGVLAAGLMVLAIAHTPTAARVAKREKRASAASPQDGVL